MSKRLYVGNLAFHTTEDVIRDTFSRCAEVTEVKLVLDRDTGRSRGFAFVEMTDAQGAASAIEQLDGSDLDGRSLRVREAEERAPRRDGGGGFGGGGGGFGGGGGGGGRGGRGGNPRRGGGGGGGGNRW